ncbi:unnamed protein product [Heligmosomoides polygyrus]|uniref:WH1 domain-containing protein n=1 Tax=Heligmosomoides polygyrus TaxID=6339 RepID=A0A183GBQ8_HELPZ|nr:unnamed protein product [Heligmosomoides polygyrus]
MEFRRCTSYRAVQTDIVSNDVGTVRRSSPVGATGLSQSTKFAKQLVPALVNRLQRRHFHYQPRYTASASHGRFIESFFYNTDEIAYLNPMAVGTANGVAYDGSHSRDRRTVIRENRISHHLTNNERGSILAYLEPSAKALCTGVCQLLQAENDIWTDMKVGVICFIRDPHVKEYALTLLLPKSDERFPAKVLWTMNVSAFFETERTSDEHLLTFVMESYPRDICGLNFYDPQEADEFHRILVDENRGRVSRRAGKPKRQAPPPPSQVTDTNKSKA